ncbi:keratin [Pimephales promelas]|nr:keratin [Pimephales promelas]
MSCSLLTSSCLGPKTMTSKSIVTPISYGKITSCTPKAYSVCGYDFGGNTRISSSCYRNVGCYPDLRCKVGGLYGRLNNGGLGIMFGNCDYMQLNEKTTMQSLNDRLASYLEKVRSLEAANATLERQIREYYENKGPICQRDYSAYWNTIDCLKEKIGAATIHNANILLQIDNSKLAADDFRMKYNHELAVRQSVEADIANLRRLLDHTTLTKADLEAQIETLLEDLACLKKNYKEDIEALLCQLTNTKVCVEVDAAPQQDLNKVLEEIRCHYETIIDKHRREQECWFKEKTAQLCKELACNTECLETSRSQISDLQRTLQCLEIELQSQISMKAALERSLLETEARYSNILAGFQKHINSLEAELCQVRSGIEQQGRDYAVLLDIKSRLEQEIATYRCLLENQGVQTQAQGCTAESIHRRIPLLIDTGTLTCSVSDLGRFTPP